MGQSKASWDLGLYLAMFDVVSNISVRDLTEYTCVTMLRFRLSVKKHSYEEFAHIQMNYVERGCKNTNPAS